VDVEVAIDSRLQLRVHSAQTTTDDYIAWLKSTRYASHSMFHKPHDRHALTCMVDFSFDCKLD